jgi:hypothetical protein
MLRLKRCPSEFHLLIAAAIIISRRLTIALKTGSLPAMQLIWFHRVLIGVAVVFFGGFGVWELLAYNADRDATALVLGLVSIVVAVALLVYLLRLKRILNLPQ